MKSTISAQAALHLLGLFFFAIIFTPVCHAAESTADVSADAALKEKARRQILGTSAAQTADNEYVVGYRDILYVSVYGEGSMAVGEGVEAQAAISERDSNASGGFSLRGRGRGIEVRIDGRVSLRHIGDVTVVGMTLTQVADYLKQLYSTIYEDPVLTVTLVQSNSQQYTVMGQVLNPGLYHLDYPLTVVKALARAGGFTEWAKSEITVIRENSAGNVSKSGEGQTFTFDYGDFLKGRNLEKNILIRPGDVIVVH
ncbi:MAG: polysaccharide biosynthesis/export family protein [Desulfobulbaceae bacterium]|nr:polysaccharide biosynthesis/export family protein [Desulfobulbaceae bacterium]